MNYVNVKRFYEKIIASFLAEIENEIYYIYYNINHKKIIFSEMKYRLKSKKANHFG